MDGQWESNDLEAFVAGDVETGSCEEGLDGFEKESLFDSVFSESDKKIDCFVSGKTKIEMLRWVSCLQLVFRDSESMIQQI